MALKIRRGSIKNQNDIARDFEYADGPVIDWPKQQKTK